MACPTGLRRLLLALGLRDRALGGEGVSSRPATPSGRALRTRRGTDSCNSFQESVAPLFEIHMELSEDGLVFSPSLEVGDDSGFLALIESLINDIYNVAKFIPRLARGRLNYKVSGGLPPAPLPAPGPCGFPGSELPPSSAVPLTSQSTWRGPECPQGPRDWGGTSLSPPQTSSFFPKGSLLHGPGLRPLTPAHPLRTPSVCLAPSWCLSSGAVTP